MIDGVLQPIELSAILGARGTDLKIGDDGRDHFFTGRGNDFADGNGGNDVLLLGRGKDVGFGGDGNDIIGGGRGRDLIDGGAGIDKLFGGRGQDTFLFKEGNEVDKIFDFRVNQDKIDISDLGYTSFDQIEHLISGNRRKTEIDFGNGDEIELIGVRAHRLDAHDFIFADSGDAMM